VEGECHLVPQDSESKTGKVLNSVVTSFEKLNNDVAEALARLDEVTKRIAALNEIHIKLAGALMKALNIPRREDLPMDFLSTPVGVISSAERAQSLASGYLRPIVRSLRRPCGEIARAITISKERILEVTGNFGTHEMDALAAELRKEPDRVLCLDEQESCRQKINAWTRQLREKLEEL
jgi:hypothetical protein